MATTFVLTRPDVFVSGSVSAYPKPALGVPSSGAPSGSAASTASVSGNSVTFTGLTAGAQYIAYQGSPDRYVSFTVAPASSVAAETDPVAGADLVTHAALTTTAHGGLVASGSAVGGVLGGTLPNPTFAADMATQAELDAVAATIPLVVANTQTADYTLVLGDAGKSVEENSASATVVTIPPNASVAFPTGTVIEICRIGAGTVTITPGAAVTIPNRVEAAGTTSRTIANQWSSASIRKRATNVWVLVGDIA